MEYTVLAIKIQGYLFTGPFDIGTTKIRENQKPVVYLVVDKHGEAWDPNYKVLAAGDTAGEAVVFADIPDAGAWQQRAVGSVSLYFYTSEQPGEAAAADRAAVLSKIMATELTGSGS